MSIFQKAAVWMKEQFHTVQQKVKTDKIHRKPNKNVQGKDSFKLSQMVQRTASRAVGQWKQVMSFLYRHKLQAILSTAIVGLAFTGANYGHTYYQSHVQAIYHVYFQGEHIGTVDDPQIVTTWMENKIQEETNRFEHAQLHIEHTFRFEEESLYKPTFDNQEVIATLKEEFNIVASAVKLVIDGQFIGYVASEEVLHDILASFMQDYVPEEYLVIDSGEFIKKNTLSVASLDENEDLNVEEVGFNQIQELEDSIVATSLGQPVLLATTFKQQIETETAIIHPGFVMSAESIKAKLSVSSVEEQVHTVQAGEVLGAIAQLHGLTLSELLALNPEVKETDILRIGQELVVTGVEPFLTVVTVETIQEEEPIKFATEVQTDTSMYRGQRKVLQKGQDGKKLVQYQITKENGREVDREVLDEEIMYEPVNEVVVQGTKVKPSLGTGQFLWPTKGGQITSSYGMRWGRMHYGIDISGVRDRTIIAADNGTVTTAGWHRDYGNYVKVSHGNGYETLYAHLSSMSVKKGQVVARGDKLGVMGSTGRSTGIHLHFEVIRNGKNVNPRQYVSR